MRALAYGCWAEARMHPDGVGRHRFGQTGRRGILVGGNFIIDRVKLLERFPEQDTLASIVAESSSNGGSAYNVLTDLARLDVGLSLEAVGCVGNDEEGTAIIRDCRQRGISTRHLGQARGISTSYTDVMTVQSTGRRTFFHHRGANDLLDDEHFDFGRTRCKILHLGYLLLLACLDRPHRAYGTRAGLVLERARRAGLLTAVDVVTEESDRYRTVVLPTLPAVDYLFINELEAEKLTGVALRDSKGRLGPKRIDRAVASLFDAGVRQCVVLHVAEGAGAYSARRDGHWHGSVRVPARKIIGTTGAGDAFAAGFLAAIHDGLPLPTSLRYGVCVAAASLRSAAASLGVGPLRSCLALGRRYGYRTELDGVWGSARVRLR
jgi:sugar/nucleoside kinase (ribokinase family)